MVVPAGRNALAQCESARHCCKQATSKHAWARAMEPSSLQWLGYRWRWWWYHYHHPRAQGLKLSGRLTRSVVQPVHGREWIGVAAQTDSSSHAHEGCGECVRSAPGTAARIGLLLLCPERCDRKAVKAGAGGAIEYRCRCHLPPGRLRRRLSE
jgi:hypothetical protein